MNNKKTYLMPLRGLQQKLVGQELMTTLKECQSTLEVITGYHVMFLNSVEKRILKYVHRQLMWRRMVVVSFVLTMTVCTREWGPHAPIGDLFAQVCNCQRSQVIRSNGQIDF